MSMTDIGLAFSKIVRSANCFYVCMYVCSSCTYSKFSSCYCINFQTEMQVDRTQLIYAAQMQIAVDRYNN